MISVDVTLSHRHSIEAALSSPYARVHSLTIRKQKEIPNAWQALLQEKKIRVHHERFNPKVHENAMEMQMQWQVFSDCKEYFAKHPVNDPSLFIFLDRLQDPQNVGNIIRTARFFGATAIVWPKTRSAKLGETVIRTSTGAALGLPIIHCTNLVRAMQAYQEQSAYIWGLDANVETVLGNEKPVNQRLGLVIGSEGEGMARLTMETCDQLMKLSNKGKHESLNASSAAAIAIYDCAKALSV